MSLDWEFVKEQARQWNWFIHENFDKAIAVGGMAIGLAIMSHAAHHAHDASCTVSLEDKLFDGGLSTATFFSGVLGTLIYHSTGGIKGKK